MKPPKQIKSSVMNDCSDRRLTQMPWLTLEIKDYINALTDSQNKRLIQMPWLTLEIDQCKRSDHRF